MAVICLWLGIFSSSTSSFFSSHVTFPNHFLLLMFFKVAKLLPRVISEFRAWVDFYVSYHCLPHQYFKSGSFVLPLFSSLLPLLCEDVDLDMCCSKFSAYITRPAAALLHETVKVFANWTFSFPTRCSSSIEELLPHALLLEITELNRMGRRIIAIGPAIPAFFKSQNHRSETIKEASFKKITRAVVTKLWKMKAFRASAIVETK